MTRCGVTEIRPAALPRAGPRDYHSAMRQRGLVSVALMAALAMGEGGCAFAFQQHTPAPPDPSYATAPCSDSHLFPVLDTVVGAVIASVGVAGLGYAWGRNHEGYVLPSGSALMLGWVTLGSARSGYRWSAQCHERGSAGLAAR